MPIPEPNYHAGPGPFEQRFARTIYLRVPAQDWIAVTRGRKTEFRVWVGGGANNRGLSALWSMKPPIPVVGWRHHHSYGYDGALLILDSCWEEPLGAISAESLQREDCEDLGAFRRYWRQTRNLRYRPLDMVDVFRVRPFRPEDREPHSERLFDLLYGDFA